VHALGSQAERGASVEFLQIHPLGAGMGAASVRVYLGLGSNLGERREHLQQGLVELARRCVAVEASSSVMQGPFVGAGRRQGEFLNVVVRGRTRLRPLQLLEVMQDVERLRGRQHPSHMQPRPLDVDLLLYGGWCIRHPRLIVPHRRMEQRRFVLEPLLEVLEAHHPMRRLLQSQLERLRPPQELTLHSTALLTGEDRAALSS
jgi:2-amino-4-hydroxy-6-hydroxymethyldihydropteridine diphosphokinase